MVPEYQKLEGVERNQLPFDSTPCVKAYGRVYWGMLDRQRYASPTIAGMGAAPHRQEPGSRTVRQLRKRRKA
jgi:hypothetical protein